MSMFGFTDESGGGGGGWGDWGDWGNSGSWGDWWPDWNGGWNDKQSPDYNPAIAGILGSLLGALGGSGKQGNQTTDQSSTSASTTTSKQTGQSTGYNQASENPLFAQFRSGLIPQFNQEMQRAQRPIYGDAQKAGFMNQLNDLTSGAMESMKGQLAGSGALSSGRFSTGMSDIMGSRLSQASQFYGQLPFQEEQARAGRVGNLLGAGMNWTGKAPISNAYGTTASQDTTSTTANAGAGTSNTTNYGAPFLTNLASNLGGSIPGWLPGLLDGWGKKQGG